MQGTFHLKLRKRELTRGRNFDVPIGQDIDLGAQALQAMGSPHEFRVKINPKPNQMKNSKNLIQGAIAILFLVGLFSTATISKAAHDHDHIYVKMVEYMGHDEAGLHMVKVNHYYDNRSHYIIVYLSKNAASLRGHQGDSLQISFSSDGKNWARLTLKRHGTWNIHHTRAIE